MACVDEDSRPKGAALGQPATGYAIAHHGELLQGVFEDEQGRLHRGLVTLPFDHLRSTANLVLEQGGDLTVKPSSRIKALRAAQLALNHIGCPALGGRLSIKSDVPIGHGYGSSTADVVASIRAVGAATGTKLLPDAISLLAVAAETASDAIAFETEALLFAQREGFVLEHFGASLPPLIVVGFKTKTAGPIGTVELPPARYTREEIQMFRVLRGLISRAVQYQDPRLLGRAATLSAKISQRHLPKHRFDWVSDLANQHQACGIQVAHSGSLFGIVLDAQAVGLKAKTHAIAAALKRPGCFQDIAIFSVNGVGELP